MAELLELIDKIKSYNPDGDFATIEKAFEFAEHAHQGQKRESGEAYFTHPFEVAKILAELKFDVPTIATALLHDTVEDTDVTIDDIKQQFGEEIALLVDGVTKVEKIRFKSSDEKTAENFRKLVVSIAKDIRVLIIKLADRLHNLQTLKFKTSKEKSLKIARETILIYAPLAERIGMQGIKEELQDLSFARVNPEAYNYISKEVNSFKSKESNITEKIIVAIENKLRESGITDFEIYGREKSPYSIWKKMERKRVPFDALYDVVAFRIIVSSIGDCYKVLGIINSNYNMIPGKFKDYISTPKDNGYQSLHTVVIGPENRKIEIQIRTSEMERVAKYGLAAHWSYKQGIKADDIKKNKYKWVHDFADMFSGTEDASDSIANNNIAMDRNQIFCFTPAGDIFGLPVDATVIDFAYAVHSDIGNKCVGAKVNGNLVSIKTKLINGDKVEIITRGSTRPSASWLQFVVTSKARTTIKCFLRENRRHEYEKIGRSMLSKLFAAEGLKFNEHLLQKALLVLQARNLDELYLSVGNGIILRNDVLKAVYPEYKLLTGVKKDQECLEKINEKKGHKKHKEHSLPIAELDSGMAVHLANCCRPIVGDSITGFIGVGRGITIHRSNCPNLCDLISRDPRRIVDVHWREEDYEDENGSYLTSIKLIIKNSPRVLAVIFGIIANKKVNIENVRTLNSSNEYSELMMDVRVHNTDHLESLMTALLISKMVDSVQRS